LVDEDFQEATRYLKDELLFKGKVRFRQTV